MSCQSCGGLGYTVEKTGVVSPHIPYTEETYKEPCDCWLEASQKKQSFLKMVKALHKGVQNLPIGWTNYLRNSGLSDEEIRQAESYEKMLREGGI